MRKAQLGIGLLFATACAGVPLVPPPPIDVAGTLITVAATSGRDRNELPLLAELAREAEPRLQRWGGLRVPTRVIVLPDHGELEARTDHRGYAWLRAWARYDLVYVQSPSSWGFFLRPSHDELRTLLTHELTHCVMYQAMSDGRGWDQLRIPLWFREGMASWSAQEEAKRLSRADLKEFCRKHPTLDPLRQADALVQLDDKLVYSAGHWAFDALMERGADRVQDLLRHLRAGQTFEVAFQAAFGETESAFEDAVLKSWR